MAKFSVSYAGIADAESRLQQLYKKVNGVSTSLYLAANKTRGAVSLANKGYATAISAHGVEVGDESEVIRGQRLDIDEIGRIYSGTERRLLEHLSESVSSGYFMSESVEIVDKALKNHKSFKTNYGWGRAFEDELDFHEVQGGVERFRFWRSTVGSKWVKKGVEWLLGEDGLDNVVVREAIKDVNKKIESFEDVITFVTHPTDLDAMEAGGKALANYFGIRGFVDMIPRYADMTDSINNRASEIWAQGDKGKAVCYTLSATTLATFQFVGDAAWNSVKFLENTFVGKGFSMMGDLAKEAGEKGAQRAWKFFGQGTKKAVSVNLEGPESLFTEFGDWCWSRLDNAYGL